MEAEEVKALNEIKASLGWRVVCAWVKINGRSHVPLILEQQGDTIIVDLKNSLLSENVTIHWHGISQIGTPWAEGTEGVTQCPILPGDTFRYMFVVDRASWNLLVPCSLWDATRGRVIRIATEALPDGVAKPFLYDYDRSIILSDWYHKSTYEQAADLSSIPFVLVGDPHV